VYQKIAHITLILSKLAYVTKFFYEKLRQKRSKTYRDIIHTILSPKKYFFVYIFLGSLCLRLQFLNLCKICDRLVSIVTYLKQKNSTSFQDYRHIARIFYKKL
jgi:hypothetical protein